MRWLRPYRLMRAYGASRRRAVRALLTGILLVLAGCGIQLPDQAPTDELQAYAYEQAYHYAGRLNVRLEAVVFVDKKYPPHGWVPCGQWTIAYNDRWLKNESWARDYVPAVAAHEACHLKYEDQMHCGSSNSISETIENRAEACARQLLGYAVEIKGEWE